MKYYYRQHILGYQRVIAEGKTAWDEIHGGAGFENFSSRCFLEWALPRLRFSASHPTVLEYGCGTGPGACFLAERGFQVDGIDIIPAAIEIAREQAAKRGLDIRYEVQDICELPRDGKSYDMIVDSYCLQCIVTEEDRESVFAAVGARLEPAGYYVISTATFDEERFRPHERIIDAGTGKVYNGYGDDVIDAETSVVWTRLDEGPQGYEDAIKINGAWHLPYRRHLTPRAWRAELEAAGFGVLHQGGQSAGDLICALATRRPATWRQHGR